MTAAIRRLLVLVWIVALVPMHAIAPAAATVGEGTAAPSFNESWGCGEPSTNGTYAAKTGSLASSQHLSGPRGDYFGRTIGQVRSALVYWTVPMSGGYRVLVHERALPAFNQVSANLAAEEAKGNHYAIKPSQTFGFSARTIAGSYQVSLHAHGDAIDVNTVANPYRSDGVLITDMPDWFVKAWTDAGFCWGGDWRFTKDPQHFSWMGPAVTPGYSGQPSAYPVSTSPADFDTKILETDTVFGATSDENQYAIADGDGDGLADVFQLIAKENGTRLEYSQTDRRHEWCAVGRDHALDVQVDGRIVLFGDYSHTGRNDLVLLDTSGGTLEIEVSLKPTGFAESVVIPTQVPVGADDDFLLGDHNRDGNVDLYVIRHGEGTTTVDVYSGEDDFATLLLSVDTGLGNTSGRLFTLGDPNLDELPDLFVIEPGGGGANVSVLANGYTTVTSSYNVDVPADVMDVAVNDYDGDGRGDLWFWTTSGILSVYLGNSQIPGVSPISWHNAANWECDPDSPPYVFDGVFRDDDDNIHEANIEVIAALGITKGCNPPYNDDYCPDTDVTRGEMAAFLVRMFGLTDDGGKDWFTDDDGSVFEADINKLATARITLGCNPPANDEYCPDRYVTRGEMAAFLVRGLGLAGDFDVDIFVDDNISIFEPSINTLGAIGITKGCNPPANDRYCPFRNVRRDEMASFIARSVALVPSQ
jgi:hypothetical protein